MSLYLSVYHVSLPDPGPAKQASDSRSTIEIRARASLTEPEGIAGIRPWLDSVEYTSDDFVTDSDGLQEICAELPNSGDVQIAVELSQNGVVVAAGFFSLSMSDNFEWGMDLCRQAENPEPTCFGCDGALGFPIDEAAQT